MPIAQKYRDLASRAAWTAAQVALGFVTVEALDIPVAWAPVIATGLSALKSWVATKVGDRSTVTFTEPDDTSGSRLAPQPLSSSTLRSRAAGAPNPPADPRPEPGSSTFRNPGGY